MLYMLAKNRPNKKKQGNIQESDISTSYLEDLQFFQEKLLHVVPAPFGDIYHLQDCPFVWNHIYSTSSSFSPHVWDLTKLVVKTSLSPVPINMTSYCPSAAPTLSTAICVKL